MALHLQRAILSHAKRTRPITWSTALEVAGVAAILIIGIHGLDVIGAIAAAVAILVGRILGTLWLLPPCLGVLRAEPALATEPNAHSLAVE